jgi:hypothetical protein
MKDRQRSLKTSSGFLSLATGAGVRRGGAAARRASFFRGSAEVAAAAVGRAVAAAGSAPGVALVEASAGFVAATSGTGAAATADGDSLAAWILLAAATSEMLRRGPSRTASTIKIPMTSDAAPTANDACRTRSRTIEVVTPALVTASWGE